MTRTRTSTQRHRRHAGNGPVLVIVRVIENRSFNRPALRPIRDYEYDYQYEPQAPHSCALASAKLHEVERRRVRVLLIAIEAVAATQGTTCRS
jgi:hypothetical protein